MPARGALLSVLGVVLLTAGTLRADDKPDKARRDQQKADEKFKKDCAAKLESYRAALEKLVRETCVKKKLRSQAADLLATLERIGPRHPTLPGLRLLVGSCGDDPDPKDVAAFATTLAATTKPYGAPFAAFAKECATRKAFARAFDWTALALEADPDNKDARAARGFIRWDSKDLKDVKLEYEARTKRFLRPDEAGKVWLSRYEVSLLKEKKVLYENADGVKEGWIPRADVEKWDEGLRPLGGEFVEAAKDVSAHTDVDMRGLEPEWKKYWSVETEHFEVRTGVSRAAAYEFGQLLEDYHASFFRTYTSFLDLDTGAEFLFNKAKLARKHLVIYYADHDLYRQHIANHHGAGVEINQSYGLYTQDRECRASHFFAGEGKAEVLRSVYHEVTHQLFSETKEDLSSTSSDEGNYWLVEGIATYSESWGKVGRSWVPGLDRRLDRFQQAKDYLEKHADWDWKSFVAITPARFRKDEAELDNYALSATLCHFLMHGEGERYREDFVRFISEFYAGKARKGTALFEALGVSPEELEREFKKHVKDLGGE